MSRILITVLLRCRSRKNTDQFPNSREVWEHAPLGNFLDFNSPKSPFLGFCQSLRQDTYWLSKPLSRIQLGKFKVFYLYLLWKIWPISVKRWKLVCIHACFSDVNFLKKLICLVLRKLRTEFTSPIAKYTTRRLSDTTFFACWTHQTLPVPAALHC